MSILLLNVHINLYPSLLDELKNRRIIRTKNIIGELGEHIVKQTYNKNPKLPKLQLGIKSTKNIVATYFRDGKDLDLQKHITQQHRQSI